MIDREIMVYSVPRTGSTLIFQCLKKIFTKVSKSHKDRLWNWSGGRQEHIQITTKKKDPILDYSCPCVITEREIMDTFLSQWRNASWQTQVHFHEWLCLAHGDEPSFDTRRPYLQWREKAFTGWTRKNDESQKFDIGKFKEVSDKETEACYARHQFKPVAGTVKSIREVMVTFREYMVDLEKVKKEYAGPVLVMQYEQFWNDYDYVFTEFENFFDITISEETKTEIKNTTRRDSNIVAQEKLKGFDQVNSTQIHGGHIFLAEPGWSSKVLGEKNLARMQKLLTCDFEEIMDIDLGE